METEKMSEDAVGGNKTPESNIGQKPFQQLSTKSSMPLIAGILLIIAGILAFVLWVPAITMDISTIESFIDISQLQELDPTITPEKIKDSLVICGVIECVLAIFVILGGVLALKRKLWRIALTGGILGLVTIGYPPVFVSSILALISSILVIISRKEFH